MKRGLTLLELVVSLVSSVFLLAGLVGSLFVASQALPDENDPMRQSSHAASVLRDVMADLSHAVSFSECSTRAITFTVPDRDGNSTSETIRYAWSGTAGDPLTYQYNYGSVINIATNVRAFNLASLTRTLLAEGAAAPVAGNVVFEGFTEGKATTNVSTISVTRPPGTTEGSLLIAALSLDRDARTSVATPSGWTLVGVGPSSSIGAGTAQQTFAVWWKKATNSEPGNYTFNWTGTRQAYAWVMRFSGHDTSLSTPINAFAVDSMGGLGSLMPNSPAVTTTVQNAMILRLGGFDSNRFAVVDVPGLLGHTPITADQSSASALNSCSGAAGYTVQAMPGTSGTSLFVLLGLEEYTTMTLAITPAQSD